VGGREFRARRSAGKSGCMSLTHVISERGRKRRKPTRPILGPAMKALGRCLSSGLINKTKACSRVYASLKCSWSRVFYSALSELRSRTARTPKRRSDQQPSTSDLLQRIGKCPLAACIQLFYSFSQQRSGSLRCSQVAAGCHFGKSVSQKALKFAKNPFLERMGDGNQKWDCRLGPAYGDPGLIWRSIVGHREQIE
jgi:hypothetical protein